MKLVKPPARIVKLTIVLKTRRKTSQRSFSVLDEEESVERREFNDRRPTSGSEHRSKLKGDEEAWTRHVVVFYNIPAVGPLSSTISGHNGGVLQALSLWIRNMKQHRFPEFNSRYHTRSKMIMIVVFL